MSSGATHARNAHAVIWISIPTSLAIAWKIDPQAIAGIGGALIGWLIEPDLDLHNVTTRSERRMWRLSPVVGYLWEVYWYPLARAIPHGSRLSHLPPLCTAIRLAYVLVTAYAVCRLWGLSVDLQAIDWLAIRWVYWAFAWWVLQDFVHLAADGFKRRRWGKKKRKRGKRRR